MCIKLFCFYTWYVSTCPDEQSCGHKRSHSTSHHLSPLRQGLTEPGGQRENVPVVWVQRLPCSRLRVTEVNTQPDPVGILRDFKDVSNTEIQLKQLFIILKDNPTSLNLPFFLILKNKLHSLNSFGQNLLN